MIRRRASLLRNLRRGFFRLFHPRAFVFLHELFHGFAARPHAFAVHHAMAFHHHAHARWVGHTAHHAFRPTGRGQDPTGEDHGGREPEQDRHGQPEVLEARLLDLGSHHQHEKADGQEHRGRYERQQSDQSHKQFPLRVEWLQGVLYD